MKAPNARGFLVLPVLFVCKKYYITMQRVLKFKYITSLADWYTTFVTRRSSEYKIYSLLFWYRFQFPHPLLKLKYFYL